MTVADEYTTAASDILDAKSTIQMLAATCRGIVQSHAQESSQDEKPRNVFPFYYYGENGIRKLRTPSPNERLSDQVVFAIIQGRIGGMCRGKIWPNVFDSDGHIKRDRIPRGPPVISWANTIPFFTVYGGYYILGGDYLAQRSWLLSPTSTPIYPGCLAGLVIASPSAISNDVMLQSEQIHAFQVESWKEINWEPKTDLERTQKNFTTYTKDHSRLSLIFFANNSFGFAPVREVAGYHLNLDPAETTTVSPTRVAIGMWNETRLERYVNNRNVQFHFPIQKFPLFFNEALDHPLSKTQSTLESPLKNLKLESESPKKKDPVTPVCSRTSQGNTTPKRPRNDGLDEDTPSKKPRQLITYSRKMQSQQQTQQKKHNDQDHLEKEQEQRQEQPQEKQRQPPIGTSPNTAKQIGQAFTTEFKIEETCLAFDDLTKVYNEIIRNREALNTSPARAIIQLHKTQHEKHAKYRDLLESVQKGIRGKDRAVKLIFQDRLAAVAFPDGDRVHNDKDKDKGEGEEEVMELDLVGSSDVSLDLTLSPSPTPALAGGLDLPTPISIDGEDVD
ncbi:hypothetical protein N7509_008041 [Penicillium cosmopolitanum]|uniref:Uncharacterized protein n=1 Tax=Penicillium cosmopolitanum TaxID=1131564 RepID=A0A9W9W078_9EURO|nr:uncharacterized protein N7509_008041 [Penicillium cosmopolitanum]KAJ5392551.1 hypothetical protein N7509_008041 [Penicillium cosmopolitanum]